MFCGSQLKASKLFSQAILHGCFEWFRSTHKLKFVQQLCECSQIMLLYGLQLIEPFAATISTSRNMYGANAEEQLSDVQLLDMQE
jgi:hypothetical protein